MHYRDGRLVLMAKAPRPGRVKTRLAGVYGRRGAARLYRSMLEDGCRRAQGLAPLELWCQPGAGHPFFRRWQRQPGVSRHRQQGRDLGERMLRAARHALARGDWVVIIGGDCVSLTRADLDLACSLLHRGEDAVLGPAEDGGYVLLGLRRLDPRLFRGIAWGGDRVLAATRRRLARLGYRWTELPLRWDADRPADIRRWRRQGLRREGPHPLLTLPGRRPAA